MQILKQQDQIHGMVQALGITSQSKIVSNTGAVPNFAQFDSTSELWADYWTRFKTCVSANSIPTEKQAQVFLTNQQLTIFKMLENLALQQPTPKEINSLTLDEIDDFMKSQFDPKRFAVRERFKFWSDLSRKPGETVQELAARIRQKTATCNFSSIKDPQDEAMRTNFICSLNNEAVLKALFKIDDEHLTFQKAIETAIEVEEAATYAKETVYGLQKPFQVAKIKNTKANPNIKKRPTQKFQHQDKKFKKCFRCDNLLLSEYTATVYILPTQWLTQSFAFELYTCKSAVEHGLSRSGHIVRCSIVCGLVPHLHRLSLLSLYPHLIRVVLVQATSLLNLFKQAQFARGAV
jgi:hypothetical protein